MLTRTQPTSSQLFKRLAVVVAVGMGAFAIASVVPIFVQPAYAQSDNAKQQQGASGNAGAQTGQGNQGANAGGQAGPGVDSEGQGPQAGAPSSTGGGKPVWAQEGIPETDLGRLSVARSPQHVLDQALQEALDTQTNSITSFYNLSLEDAIDELSLNWDNVTIYDSPLQSLALLEETLKTSISPLPGVTSGSVGDFDNTANNTNLTLEALFLGVASDKEMSITTDTVIAVTTILGYPVTGTAAEELAAAAEAVRIAVLAGHG